MSTIKIGILDDHPIVSRGLADFFNDKNNQFIVEFTANNRTDLLEKLGKGMPDVLIVDIVVPDINGLDLFSELIKTFKGVKVIAYSTLRSPVLVENLLTMGVRGYVNKNQEPEELATAVKDVYYDLISVPQKYKFLTSRFREPESSLLTKREMEILLLIAAEETTQQIATKLGVSPKTVENQKIVLFKKLDVKNAAGLVLAATRLGYVS
jgi:DNA-binding NarL/FixJ family response regulator